MPEDTTVLEHGDQGVTDVESIENDADFDAAFDAGAEDKPMPEVEDKGEQAKEPEHDAKPSEGEGEKPAEPEKNETPAKEKTAMEKLAERGKVIEEAMAGTKEPEKKEPEAAPEKPAEKVAAPETSLFEKVDFDSLPDVDIKVGKDGVINLKKYAEDFPEEARFATVMATNMAQAIFKKAVADGQVVSSDKFGKLEKALQSIMYWNAVSDTNQGGHADARQVFSSKEYKEWIAKQPIGIRTLDAKSPHPADSIHLLNAFKEDTAKGKTKEFDKKAGEKKKRFDDLHGHTMRGNVGKKGVQDDMTEDDAFNLAIKEANGGQ